MNKMKTMLLSGMVLGGMMLGGGCIGIGGGRLFNGLDFVASAAATMFGVTSLTGLLAGLGI